MFKVYETELAGRKLAIETGKMAGLANGSVLVRYGDTCVMVNVTASKEPKDGIDFFPLSVDYEEKLYSVGKIPGSYTKREGKPSDKAILTSRAIDRPLRPLFPKDFRNDVVVVATVLSVDQDNSPEVAAMIGASAALSISDIPFGGPTAAVNVGLVNGEIVINPTEEQRKKSDLNLTVAGTADKIAMIEAGANEVSNETMLDAIKAGHVEIKKICEFISKMKEEIGKPKFEYKSFAVNEEIYDYLSENYKDAMKTAVTEKDKTVRDDNISALTEKINTEYAEKFGEEKAEEDKSAIGEALYKLEKKVVRDMIFYEHKRVDGRNLDEIRPLSCEVGLLPRVHGSAMFTRGLTQVMSIATLGMVSEEQVLDGIDTEESKRYMHHYNFPSYSVGEARPSRGPGRREVGHGALAEKALVPVLPSKEEFPYAIRVVSEVLSSNGSTSQASICGSTLSLMDAGVPIKRPVSGVAMGLMVDVPKGTPIEAKDVDKAYVLTDLMDAEDFAGDMDFKVTGTTEGVTALQMDMKVHGLPVEIMEKALKQSHEGRMFILKHLTSVLPEPRAEISKYAPQIEKLMINPEKIGAVIGKGGEMINKITTETGAEVDIEDNGLVTISGNDPERIAKALEWVKSLTEEPEVGKIYEGTVVSIKDFGAFVNILPGIDGMLHISQIREGKRLKSVDEVLKVGDRVKVRLVAIDHGKLSLSMIGVK